MKARKAIINTLMMLALGTCRGDAATKYVLSCRRDMLTLSGRIALSQAGTIELHGKNDGPVMAYLASVGINRPAPYCAAGQYYCWMKAAEKLRLPASSIPILKTASCSAMRSNAKKKGRKVYFKPEVHDLIFWAGKSPPDGHVERVIRAGRAGNITTIGFNTSVKAGGRIIEGVFLKKRNLLHPISKMTVIMIIGFTGDE